MNAELERFDPAEQDGRIVYEHLHRYALCRELVAGRRVLDLACGTGYGSAILGTAAAHVTGVDVSSVAIRIARKRYKSQNVKFVIGDCFDLPFEDGSFDVVVANEMIEHVEDHDGLLREVRRVLADKGLLLVSTPNKPVYNRYKPPNAFHVSEMDVPTFRKLLSDRFKHVRLTGTRMALLSVGYAMDPEAERNSANLNAARIHLGLEAKAGEPKIGDGELNLADPEYVLAAASDAPLDEVALPSSVFFDQRNDLWLEHEKIMAWASGLHEEDEALRADVVRTRELLEEARGHVARIEAERADLAERLEQIRNSQSGISTAVENERQALAREAESLRRDAGARLTTLAQILGQMGVQDVAAEETAIISSLFKINESLVTERLNRSQADERNHQLASKVDALENRLGEVGSEKERLSAELKVRATELEAERNLRMEIEAARAALAEEVGAVLARLSVVETESTEQGERLAAEIAARSAELETERRLRAELEAAHAALAEEERLAKEKLAEARSEMAEHTERLAFELSLRAETLEAERRLRADLEAERLSAVEQIQSLRDLLSATQSNSAEREQSFSAELTKHADDLEAERRRRAELEASRESLEQALRQAEGQLRTLSAELDEIKADRQRVAEALRTREQAKPSIAPPSAAPVAPTPATPASMSLARTNDTENRARQTLAILQRRTANDLATATQRVMGKLPAYIEPAPFAWHERVLGKRHPRFDTKIFNSQWVAKQDPSYAEYSVRRFIADPACRAISPHPLFDAALYLSSNPDVAESGMSPLVHYVLHGWREGRDPHPLFANDWYLAQNPDVLAAGNINPLDHYLLHGWREGRRPNPLFNPRSYLARYPDVEAGEFEPLSHFILHGRDEGRELGVDGLNQALSDIVAQGDVLTVMERLLRQSLEDTLGGVQTAAMPPQAQVVQGASSISEPAVQTPAIWPPAPVDDFWPAQTMREMISETRGEPLLSRIWYLLSLMNRWQDRQSEFGVSDDCRGLLDRLRMRAAALATPDGVEPSASIIIPVYNNVLDTLLCLSSVLELEERNDFEVIVADDGSTDATPALIASIGGNVRYLRQPRNFGFLGNCNAAAQHAIGKTIVLLNNDTLVFSGWLDGLLDPIANMQNVGMVGSKLINWDGTLQEAGGIFWRDGSAWNFGRNQDVQAPEFNYLKDVDYCSGASIAVPTRIWREVGGFDPIYSPAYCEDSDLAFRLREAGYRTLYNPASEVVHHEGRSHGRDVSSGIKAYQVTNNAKLLDRWQHVLVRDHFPNAQNVVRARDRSFAKKHVLVVDHYVPQADRDAGSRTLYQYMKVLVDDGFAVTFWPDNLWRDPIYTPQLQQLGIEVIYGAKFRNGFARFIDERSDVYDFVFLSRPHVAKEYITALRAASKAKIVYYGHDLHFARMQAAASSGQAVRADDIEEMRKLELSVCQECDVILYPDPDEVRLMEQQIGNGKEFVANPVFLFDRAELQASRALASSIAGRASDDTLLFVGGFRHDPNVDGIKWFVSEVLPLVLARRPGVKLNVVGSNVPAEVQRLASSNVHLLGFVSDAELEAIYRHAAVAIAPLRYGAGVKGKVIEAMARAVPVATTSIGAQGIELADNSLFVGDSASALSDAVLLALENRELAQRKANAALDFIERKYSEEVMIEFFRRIAANG